jgi:hypothetical protein
MKLFFFCSAVLLLSSCSQLTWATGQGGKHPARYEANEPVRRYNPERYQVISGKDKQGAFKYVSYGAYPGLTGH